MAAPLKNGLRGLRISALRTRRPCPVAYSFSFYSLRRQLSTSIPRFATAAQAAAADVGEPVSLSKDDEPERTPFTVLQGKVSNKTLKAITVNPMKLTHMTSVQEAVLSLLPEIAEPLKPNDDGSFEMPSKPRDLVVRAKTGTGKTLAFLVPAIEARAKAIEEVANEAKARAGAAADKHTVDRAVRTYVHTHLGALILTPTRELAQQIAVEAERLSKHHDFQVHLLRGGESVSGQIRTLLRGRKDIVVSTTGRLLDLMGRAKDVMDIVRTAKLVVLDEADTMLDMGFRPDVDRILPELPPDPERQTFLFSATLSVRLEREVVSQAVSKHHTFINTVSEEDSPVHAHIPQYHTVLTSAADQLPHTLRLIAHDQLTNPGKSKVILFLPTTKMTQLFSSFVRELAPAVLPSGRYTNVYELHSKRSMESRVKTSDRFRADDSGASILVTSDVSARGVDYPGITRVIQLGVPSHPDQYVHRVGRTGRAGSTQGRGDLVLLPWEHGYLRNQLSHVPMKPVTAQDLEQQVHEIAERYDEDPKAFFPPVSRSQSKRSFTISSFKGNVAEKLRALKEEIKELWPGMPSDQVEETFASMLGYYIGRIEQLRTSRNMVLEGLRAWTVEACGLEQAPYVSEAFLRKIGFHGNGGGSRNSDRSGYGRPFSSRSPYRQDSWQDRGSGSGRYSDRSERSGPNRWEGRGSRSSKIRRATEAREAGGSYGGSDRRRDPYSRDRGSNDWARSERPRDRDSSWSNDRRRGSRSPLLE